MYKRQGHIWSRSESAPLTRAKLSSYGAGMRANLTKNLYATIEVAKPMSSDVDVYKRQGVGRRGRQQLHAQEARIAEQRQVEHRPRRAQFDLSLIHI